MTTLDEAPDLFEAPEADEERAGYRLRSLAHCTWAMRKLAALRRRQLDVATTAQAEIDRIREWACGEDAKLARDAAWFDALIQAYALDERAADPRRKAISTPYGVAKTRLTPAPWDIDEAVFLAWLRDKFPDLVKTSESVRLGDAKRTFEVVGSQACDPVTGEQVPGVKVGEPTVTASVVVDLALLADDEDDR